ncbi:MAG: LD-carboxypeptidase [Sphingomonas sp.]|uniref:LD-carboxypeptidase n=1 Tax=Sphingomonas sp. TaxID=28214 RepID=UPI001AC8497D|nr:LD-carboxypeptidase [Sphingomonas sp.]MBN8813915.1 LD-carboxypeptidase [Sphingomonas sp.]
MKIAVMAPANRVDEHALDAVPALAAEYGVELVIDPQCWASGGGHTWAGPDQLRADTFLKYANDPSYHAIWFARGGYGSNRLFPLIFPHLEEAAKHKAYIGYSDMGFLLGALYARKIGKPIHGPMPVDINRKVGGRECAARTLAWLTRGDKSALEPGIIGTGKPAAAFNLSILAAMIGTKWLPDLADHDLLVEEVSEHLYRVDRMMFTVANATQLAGINSLRVGTITLPDADGQADFGHTPDQIAWDWSKLMKKPYEGRALIGHDAANHVVPFGQVIPKI